MILPNQPPSSYDGEDQDRTLPPPYQETVPSSQLLPSERPTSSLYAPSVSSRPDPLREGEMEPAPRQSPLDEKNPTGFPEPPISTGRTNSDPLLSPSKEKEREREGPAQRAFDMFSSMVWGAAPGASTSSLRSPNPASASSTSAAQDPLNPAPPAFTRPTPKNYAYLPFQPMTMLGISSNLADGFPIIPPPINPEDERDVGKANPQHPFVSHDITEEDWSKFLADLKAVASNPNQTQQSFLARLFLGEMNERDQRKRAIHFIDSWNHYFFQPRRMTVVLARGRKIFNGASDNHHHRRHSVGHGRGRGTGPTKRRDHRNRHRSHSTDSSSSDSSISSVSSIHSTASEPPEMPVPHTHKPSPGGSFTKGTSNSPEPWVTNNNYRTDHGSRTQRDFGGPTPGLGRGGGRRCKGRSGHTDHGWNGGRGGRGWCAPGVPGPSMVPPIPGLGDGPSGGEPWQSPTHHDHKRALRAEKRGMKHEHRQMKREHRRMKRAIKYERRQRRLEVKAMRCGEESTRGDQPWKLIISFHGARGGAGQS